ncbi:MAG: tyrosine-type recombinase/integrase, partial [Zavarzinia sp.]|nr:tyrosine-type recombinase/integrase [Zavarzinia sp.]
PEVFMAARLASLTGLRQSDLLRLSWSHVKDYSIEIRTGKSGGKKTTLIPLYGELRDFLATIPKRSTRVLVNSAGQPWKSGFGSSWNKTMKAGKFGGLHFHDLRGTAATRFYLGDLKIREIAEIMTWSEDEVERLIDRYVKRDELLKDRIRRMSGNAGGTDLQNRVQNRDAKK